MVYINIDEFEIAIRKIDNGFIFEKFAQSFLCAYFNYEFLPVGGSNDKGIDGFSHTYMRKGYEKRIYQISTEANVCEKIDSTIKKLIQNKITFDHFTYVTNRHVNNKDKISDDFFDNHSKPLVILDIKWFTQHVSHSPATMNAYHVFISSYIHEFKTPGRNIIVSDLTNDPRLFVFLRQQFENRDANIQLDEVLADSLILFTLEGTDSNKEIFKTAEEIKKDIEKYIKFHPQLLYKTIDRRLNVLSTKPRKIRHHKKIDAYCLPYETRIEIDNRDYRDKLLQDKFYEDTEKELKIYLKEPSIQVRDLTRLIDETIQKIFYQQGLEFSNFLIHKERTEAFEKGLPDIINQVVDESSVVNKNKQGVKTALLMTIREIIYNGTKEQREYLLCLSNTYLMMFLLQWDPKIMTYFESLASKLDIYVCTSIIIPALSEFYLNQENRRYWNLLKSIKNAGAKLIVNETILAELVAHFKKIVKVFHRNFKDTEHLYINDEESMLYVDDILIRAYFYAKRRAQVHSFNEFIDSFINPDLKNIKDNLLCFLKGEFGIDYLPNESIDVKTDEDISILYERLKAFKDHEIKAKTDATLILSIYKIRERNNESDSSSIFGYKTWWLSTDTRTYRAITSLFKDKYDVSCYIRPDFLYNYIALAPKKSEVDEMYKNLFPGLIGINLSYHLPPTITKYIQEQINEHNKKSPARINSILRDLSDRLKSEPSLRSKRNIKKFWENKGEITS